MAIGSVTNKATGHGNGQSTQNAAPGGTDFNSQMAELKRQQEEAISRNVMLRGAILEGNTTLKVSSERVNP